MITAFENLSFALPEIILSVTALLSLLADLFFKEKCKSIAYYIGLTGIVFAGLAAFVLIGNNPFILFSGLFISDDLAQLMKLFILISSFLCFFYSRAYLEAHKMPESDYYVLGLFSILGMLILVSAWSLLTIFLGLELLSLPLYTMTAIRRDKANCSEAALKYFVMGAMATGILLYGMSLLYGATGKLGLTDIATSILVNWQSQPMLITFALVFILTGLGFKLAAVPYHMWAPDVYQGAPTPVTLFISAAPKIAALAVTLRLLTTALSDITPQWQQMILVMALLSTGLGNLLAVTQTQIKRLLAYSAISHIGYALFGILAATAAGFAASLYYILVYALMTVAAFGLVVLLSRNGVEIDKIEDLRGLNKRNPWLAFLMMIVMFSMAGVPPTVGFFTKLLVLKALIDVNMIGVAVAGLFFAVIGAYYYIKVIMVMYFKDPVAEVQPIEIPLTTRVVFSINALSLLYLGIFPSGLINLCTQVFN